MVEDSSKKGVLPIEGLIKEYRHAYAHHHFLDGFGNFLAIDAMISAKEKMRENFPEKAGKHESDSAIDTFVGERYFKSLANAELEMHDFGQKKGHVIFSKVRSYVENMADIDFEEISCSPSEFLCGGAEFIHGWVDDLLRASLRGLNRAGCEILDLPVHYRPLNERTGSHTVNGEKKNDVSSKNYNSLKRLVLLGFAGVFLMLGVNKSIDFYVFNQTKKDLRQKEEEWEMRISNVPFQVRYTLEGIADKYIEKYYPDININIPFEEKWYLFWMRVKEDGKQEIKNEITSEINKVSNDDLRKWMERFLDVSLSEQGK